MSKHTIPTELNIAPRGKSWLHGQLIDGDHGHPTRQSMESADRAQAIEAAPAQATPAAVAVPDGIAAFEKLLDASMTALTDRSSAKEHVQIWDDAHDALEAWKARAALAATPAPAAPLPLLVRDIARELGITCAEACLALKPLGNFSTNTAVTAEMMAKLRECFPERVPASEVAGARDRMTAGRACYFMERFLKEEKLLGPNEQAALHYVIDMLEAAAAPVVLPEPDALISEVMGLVDEWGMESHLRGEAELDARHSEATQEEIDCAKDRASKQRAAWKAIETKLRALLAGVSAPAAQAAPPEWDKVRRGLTMLMVGFSGRPDCTESAAEAALDAATEPGMPLASLRILSGAQAEQEVHDDAMDWDQLPEDPSERAMFDRNLELLYGGDPRIPIATSLRIWANTRGNGSFGLMCAILANEVAKLHIAPQAQADARDTELLDFLKDQCIDLRCFTTSDGEDVGWRTVQHHMGEPRERVVSEVCSDEPRRAIREAMARIERDPYCTGPLHLEDEAAIAAQAAQQGGA